MRVLVTGAAGFIGAQVTRRIVQEGHTVWAAVSREQSTWRLAEVLSQVSLAPLDLRDRKAVSELVNRAQPDCAIHLAWYAVPGQYWTSQANLDCVTMTLHLAQRLAEVGCRRLVAAGSCAEYDWDYGFLSEDFTPLKPRTLYGVCKNATRDILESFCKDHSLGFAWTRFFHLYGPGEAKERLVPSVILALLGGQLAECTDGEQMRDYLHVEDVASAVWAVAKSSLMGAVNIGSGQPVTVGRIVRTIAELVGQQDKIVLGALPTNPGEPPLLVADVRKLKLHTGWTPAWQLQDGLRQTVSWWQENLAERKGNRAQTLESLSRSR
jgi:nucleoside-diphosphate-sugar epimerase